MDKRCKLTEAKVIRIRSYTAQCTDRQLADKYDVAKSTIRDIRIRATWKHVSGAIVHKRPNKLTRPQALMVRMIAATGVSDNLIADTFHTTTPCISKIRLHTTHKNIGGPYTRRRTRNHNTHRFTVEMIRENVWRGCSQESQARRFKVSSATVSRIINGSRHGKQNA